MKPSIAPDQASLSGEDGLPEIDRQLIGGTILITLDGREISECVSYSVPRGFVRVLVSSSKGPILLGDGDDTCVATCRLDGRVAVSLR